MATVDNSEREFLFEAQVRSPLFEHFVDFDCAEALTDEVSDSHEASAVLVPVRL